MATHSSVLAWRIPGTVEPDGLLSMVLHRVGHNWSDLAAAAAAAADSSVGKESACKAGDPSSIPGSGRSAGEGIIYPLQYLGLPAGKESACNAGDLGSIPGLGRSPGEGKGYPVQYSGLENSMDYIVHGATKGWTRLSDFKKPSRQSIRT